MRNNYRLVLSFIFIFSLIVSGYAQKRTYSPYSRYGLGEYVENGFGRNAAMGHTGIALTSPQHLNDVNPASYFSMDSLSFFFEGGVNGYQQKLTTDQSTSTFSDMNFAYFAVGFPMSKWGAFSLGVKPASVVGYSFYNDNSGTESPSSSKFYKYEANGVGNTNKAYVGIAISPIKKLSLGVHVSYFFGNIKHTSIVQFPNDGAVQKLATQEQSQINDFLFDFGAQYTLKVNEKQNVVIGATFTPKTPMRGRLNRVIGKGNSSLLDDNMLLIAIDTLYATNNEFNNNAFEMPLSYGIGVAYNLKDKLTVTADYSTSLWSDAKFPETLTKTTDAEKMAFGVEYIPKERSANSYLARIRYRAGSYYKKDYLVLNNHQLEEFGISFGLGLPVKRSKSSISLAFEYGQKGTTDSQLVKEDFLRFSLNFTLHEYWFAKRKFE